MNSQTIEGRFCYYAECNFATLESLKMRKSSSKYEIKRQQSICDGMVSDLLFIDGLSEYLERAKCPRLREAVAARLPPKPEATP